MTQGSPNPSSRSDAEFVRRLALAILSTLESKGLLTRLDVDTILHAAHLAAQSAPAPVPAPEPESGAIGPAVLGTRWVKPPALAQALAPQAATQADTVRAAPPAALPADESPVLDSLKQREEQEERPEVAPPASSPAPIAPETQHAEEKEALIGRLMAQPLEGLPVQSAPAKPVPVEPVPVPQAPAVQPPTPTPPAPTPSAPAPASKPAPKDEQATAASPILIDFQLD